MIEGWHVWLGGTAALGIVVGLGKWGYSVLNGKANRATTDILFKKVDANTKDITELKTDVATTKVSVKNIEERTGKMDGKLDRLLERAP